MDIAGSYLLKHAVREQLIPALPSPGLKYILVIPAYKESGLLRCLDSFFSATPPADGRIEIFVVINYPESVDLSIKEFHRDQAAEIRNWIASRKDEHISAHILECPDLPDKHAGPGLARKIGMDEAVRRFSYLNRMDGLIISSDADTSCNKDYFTEISYHFSRYPKSTACSICFEHPVDGNEHDPFVYESIRRYELHLRYYMQSQRATGHPNVYHTVGSAFAVKAEAYCKCGGMNQRKAGEDFYFLQKLIDLGNYSECNTAVVYPSPRPSDRVPFGTGAAIQAAVSGKTEIKTYDPLLFGMLHKLFQSLPEIYRNLISGKTTLPGRLHPLLESWLNSNSFDERLNEIASNTSDEESFKKRFFRWFNMFKMMKFLNYGSSTFPLTEVETAAREFLRKTNQDRGEKTLLDLLKRFREMETQIIHPL